MEGNANKKRGNVHEVVAVTMRLIVAGVVLATTVAVVSTGVIAATIVSASKQK